MENKFRYCRLYAFVLMTNHFHLLALGETYSGVSGLMQSVGRRYVRYVNGLYCRTGTLFEGRFKSSLVDSECYLLTCMRYIEFNPVRAGMVTKPEGYRWSSHRHHIAVSTIDWLSEPEEYRRLAGSLKARRWLIRNCLHKRCQHMKLKRFGRI